MRIWKTIKLLGVLVFVVLIVGACAVPNKNDSPVVKTFEVSKYEDYIKEFSLEENLGSISDEKDLLKKVEAFWIELYGEQVKKQKPYQVFYDEANGIWLVQGTLRSNMLGGVANILVESNTGKVLAVWHNK